jgi:hypothetical protein
MSHTRIAGIAWRRGAFRLWIVASVLWSAVVLSLELINTNVTWFASDAPATVHVRFSNTETWDYPVEWGLERIRAVLEKRVADLNKKEQEWVAQLPAARKAACNAFPPTTSFADEPADCSRLFWANSGAVLAVPEGWETQINSGPAPVSAWRVIVAATPWAVGPPVLALTLGASLFWVFAGFRRNAR